VPVRIGRRDVQLTNLDKVFFPEPGLTKGDLVRHYLDHADCILPHVRRRPMQMLRYPDGVDGFFYQKRVPILIRIGSRPCTSCSPVGRIVVTPLDARIRCRPGAHRRR
jgi:hypothetical protein